MVQKFCKRGVYSGNTLRASNSLYRRRYAKQACVVRKMFNQGSNVTSEIFPSMLGVNADDVVFSLNKKRRWTLSACIQRAISSASSGDVSNRLILFEKHKLKRHADCIAFYSNKGSRKRLVPKTGRYFSEKSVLNCDTRSKRNRKKNKTITPANGEDNKLDRSQEPVPEVRYELFYPCATKSSIAHNPKYITSSVGLTENGDNHSEVGKSRKTRVKKRRVRLSWKNISDLIDDYKLENVNDDDVLEVEDISIQEEKTTYAYEPLCLSQYITGSPSKKFRKSPKNEKSSISNDIYPVLDSKPRRIIYTQDNAGFSYRPEEMSNNEKGKGLYNVIKSPLSVPITVNLPADNTEPQFLEQTYRENYHEAKTIPRTFIIDISENLKNFLKTSPFFKHISAQDIDVSSYLVFTHTGLCHNEMHAFRVKLNASLNMDVISLNTMYDDESISSISDVIERTLAFYCTLSEDTLSVRKSPLCYQFASPKLSFDLVKSANKWHAEGAFPAGCQFRSELTEQQTENTNICNEDTVFCQICFEEMCVQGGKPFTALSTCKHWFCDGCWRQYLLNSVNYSGLLRIRCPEYGCETVVDITTMLIFLNIRNINHLHQRNVSINVQASQNKKWCPFPDCGRVLVTSATTGDVATVPTSMTCGCGTSLCFKCMQAAHWPASCEQIKLYKEEILKQKDYRKLFYHDEELFEEATTFVEVQGKSCPGCSYFIQKDGGCPYMRCPCGVAFCWSCLQEWYTHNGNKCSETNSSGNTKSFFLDNIDRDKESDISTSTLYRLAVDRRLARHPSTVNKLRSGSRALARSLNDIAAKDVAMRTLIEEKSGSLKIQTTVLNKLYYIMRTILGVKIEVDHVIEFTAVLLLDGTMKRKQQKLLSLMSGLGDISSEFKSILENGKNQKVTYSFTRVFKLQERAGMNIAILSKIIYE